jgi:hypothetical protein
MLQSFMELSWFRRGSVVDSAHLEYCVNESDNDEKVSLRLSKLVKEGKPV